MKFWAYSTKARSCGKCNRTIPGGEIALKLSLQSAPHVKVWRCTVCVGPPPPDIVQTAEAILTLDDAALKKRTLMDQLEAIGRSLARQRPDYKTRQSGEVE